MINEIGRAVTPLTLTSATEEQLKKQLQAPELPKGIDFVAITKELDDNNKDGEVDALDLINKERLLSNSLEQEKATRVDKFV